MRGAGATPAWHQHCLAGPSVILEKEEVMFPFIERRGEMVVVAAASRGQRAVVVAVVWRQHLQPVSAVNFNCL
ncbi:hypothetical protein O3P69_010511 [Scylla paramamosain]|uniref:Uncharacterized protein n=1 Tax=Scylla paramamosain TaxID=85552 RepID=A0AAW0TT09_SCYPA